MKSSQPHLDQLYARDFQTSVAASREEPETDGALPTTDSEYLAFARRSNNQELSLIVILPTGRMRGFQYAHLDSDSDFTAECITLRFMGLSPQKVTIHGRNMSEGFKNIHAHRVAWIRVAARPFAEDGEAIISAVEIRPIKDDEEEPETNPVGARRDSGRSAGGGSASAR